MYTIGIILLTFLTILRISGSRSQNIESPCPSVFRYRNNQRFGLYGEINIVVDPTDSLQLNVQLSIGNAVKGYSGKIEPANSKEVISNALVTHQPIVYYLHFPAWLGLPPKVTQILVNGKLVCSGPGIPLNAVSVVTTLNLFHTIKLNKFLYRSNNTPINNFIPIVDVTEQRPPSSGNNPNLPPPLLRNHPADSGFFVYNTPDGIGGLSIQVNPEFEQDNTFNFNPVLNGEYPAEVYRGNPFFRNVTDIAVDVPTTSRPTRENPKPTQSHFEPFLSNNFESVSKDNNQSVRSFESICGQFIRTNHLIFNGQVVSEGAYPWLVAVFKVESAGPRYICAGSLISNKHVVTAAHCVKTEHNTVPPKDILLILGKLNIKKWTPTAGEKIVESKSIHVHPDYKRENSDADIAVLVLSETLEFTKYIMPICLWREDTSLNRIVGYSGTVVGWGKDESGTLSEIPKQISLPVVSQEKCLASQFNFHFYTSNRTFCAGFRNGTGPCNGDSGAGFVIKWNERWILRGIVSVSVLNMTTGCDLSNYVVFCDASKFTNWLSSFF